MDVELSFEESMKELDLKRGMVSVGQRVKGRVVLVGSENVFVDIGLKQEAYVERGEFEAAGLELPKEGDEVELFVLSTKDGIRLGRAIKAGMDLEGLKGAYRSKIPLEGKVLGLKKGGYNVSIAGRVCFCPLSQISNGPVPDPEAMVGKTFTFLIQEMDGQGRDIVVSRKEVLIQEMKERQGLFVKKIMPGQVIRGIVRSTVPYGAFIEIGPKVQGLLHIKDMAWSPPDSVEEFLKVGQELEVMVKEVETLEDGRTKLSFSLKDLIPDPWQGIEERYSVGDIVEGKVKRIVPYGAFVDIGGVEGLVHISEMSYLRRITRPEDVVRLGQDIKVMIKSIDPKGRRLSLSLKDVEGDPWAGVPEKYKPGDLVEGVVSKRLREGYLVSLEPGVTGYLPRSSVVEDGLLDPKGIREQDRIWVEIVGVDLKEKRIRLRIGREKEELSGYNNKPDPRLGTLGEFLKKAFQDADSKTS